MSLWLAVFGIAVVRVSRRAYLQREQINPTWRLRRSELGPAHGGTRPSPTSR
jgi:hypothetical protein